MNVKNGDESFGLLAFGVLTTNWWGWITPNNQFLSKASSPTRRTIWVTKLVKCFYNVIHQHFLPFSFLTFSVWIYISQRIAYINSHNVDRGRTCLPQFIINILNVYSLHIGTRRELHASKLLGFNSVLVISTLFLSKINFIFIREVVCQLQ